uniref:Rab-GAP TBC domain-containing protein n=1 Tax=Palpitomonas bilix TaxID=652834 RepID=A0A7S3D8N3_9EUKA|mmetsp:Transcript_26247/g.66749  ORF Transcript_26247/g.66749 Transcript_26247/m.66749 type:complete len:266 (+) Transcript_26247:153-950(+)
MADIGEDAPSTPTKRGKERVRSDSVSTRSDITSETTPSEVATPSTVAEAVRSIAAAKYDRYGFKIEDESKETEKERRRRFETENRRLVKWMKMMGGDGENWDLYKRKHMDKVKERVRKGLPDAIRGLGWRIFAHSGSLQEKNKGLYEVRTEQCTLPPTYLFSPPFYHSPSANMLPFCSCSTLRYRHVHIRSTFSLSYRFSSPSFYAHICTIAAPLREWQRAKLGADHHSRFESHFPVSHQFRIEQCERRARAAGAFQCTKGSSRV